MQANDSFRLVVRRGPQPNQVYELNKDIVTIGRDITNDITINDPEVSRHHLRFTRGAGGFTLEDLGSTNGTFVNGQRLTGAKPLNNGDLLALGETVTLGYELARPMAGPPVSAPPPDVMAPPAGARPPVAQPPPSYSPPPVAPQPQQQPPAYNPYAPPGQQQQPPPASYSPQGQTYNPPPPPQSAAYSPPPPPGAGYDYDPYAVREEEPRSMTRWIIIGCLGVAILCCCMTIIAAVLVDQLCLYDRIPLLPDLLSAIGFPPSC